MTLLLAAIQPENIELSRGALSARSDTKTGPMPRPVHPESASDPLSLKLGLDRRPFDSLYSQDRSFSLCRGREGHPRRAARKGTRRARAEPDPPKSQPTLLSSSPLFREKGEFHNFGNSS